MENPSEVVEILSPVTPGEILNEEFLKPMDLSASKLALKIGVPRNRITEIINGKRSITADTAIRLSVFFNMSSQFWLNLQGHFDLEMAERAAGEEIRKTVRPYMAEAA